jgi:hypothetical protein
MLGRQALSHFHSGTSIATSVPCNAPCNANNIHVCLSRRGQQVGRRPTAWRTARRRRAASARLACIGRRRHSRPRQACMDSLHVGGVSTCDVCSGARARFPLHSANEIREWRIWRWHRVLLECLGPRSVARPLRHSVTALDADSGCFCLRPPSAANPLIRRDYLRYDCNPEAGWVVTAVRPHRPPPRPGMKIDQRDLTVTKVLAIPRTALAQPASYSSQPQQGRAGGSEDGGGILVLRRALTSHFSAAAAGRPPRCGPAARRRRPGSCPA